MHRNSKIPVTVVTGFLGAGKTTFINRILKKYAETQFALVENEFGEISIDTKLIKGVDASQMFELREGCICCTITDEYELVLQELAERFPNVEHLLIETTGIADPSPVIQPFYRDENLKEIYRFNGTVCLVDALNFESQPEQEISLKQIAVADSILLNKSDCVEEKQRITLKETIHKLNPFAPVFFSEHAKCEDFELDKITLHNIESASTTHSHAALSTQSLIFNQPLDKDDFVRRFSYMLDINKTKIYRVKGIVNFRNEPYEYILQGVGGSFEITESENFSSGASSEIVLIGKLSGADLTF